MVAVSKKLNKILSDPYEFISRLKIIDKKGKIRKLKPTSEQLKIIETLETEEDVLILKPRQIGSSTINLAYLFYKLYTAKEPVTFAILSHKLQSSKHLLNIVKTYYNNLPLPLRRTISEDNTTTFTFADTGASIIAVSAEGKGGLRSFTCSRLLISEYAFAPNPEELKATAISALNDGQLIIESTANQHGDALHKEVTAAQIGDSPWHLLFFKWFNHTQYSTRLPPTFQITQDEDNIKQKYDLSDEQIYWRRRQVKRLGWNKFRREYPACIEDAFTQSGDSYFTSTDLQYITEIQIEKQDLTILHQPRPDDRYAIGVDVASGSGGDYSVIYVLSKLSGQPVCIFRSKHTNTNALAKIIQELGTKYNNALVLCEANNYGHALLNELRHLGYSKLWKDHNKKDWLTTSKSKIELFETLKAHISEGILSQIDSITTAELRSFVIDKTGLAPSIPSNLDHHGDSVIALGLAIICLKHVSMPTRTHLPAFIKQRRASKIRSSGIAKKQRRY